MTYILAEHYQQVKDYVDRQGLNPFEVRFLDRPEVLKGVSTPEVLVLGDGSAVSDALVDTLARKNAKVTYAQLSGSSG